MRKLASVQKILDIQPIEGADKIVRATIGGWNVVTAIDNGFKVNDLVIYFEIDSWIPHEVAPFLTKVGQYPKVFEGVEGQRLKTIKLRNTMSQGLILPLSILNNYGKLIEKSYGKFSILINKDIQLKCEDRPNANISNTKQGDR